MLNGSKFKNLEVFPFPICIQIGTSKLLEPEKKSFGKVNEKSKDFSLFKGMNKNKK